MKKIALSLFLILCQANLFAADKKVTELTASTSVSTDDLLMVIDDPGGSPANKKITVSNFAATMPASGSTTQVQYNNSGVFGADSTFTHDSATGTVTSYAYSAALGESRIQDTTYGGYIDFNDSTNLGTVRIGSVGNLYNNSFDIDAESTFETIKITSATNVQLFDYGTIGVLSSSYLSSPNLYGGSATGSTLTIKGSSNTAPTDSGVFINPGGTGNVGIGTTTVSAGKLVVSGNISATTFDKVTITAPASAATLTLADGSTLATSGAYSTTITATGTTTVTLPTTGTLATLAQAETWSNKRITRRTGSTTSSATPTINTDSYDKYILTAQAAAITSFTTNLSGTPNEGDFLEIQIKDDGTARAITWGASFAASGMVALPTTTVISTTLRVIFEWDATASKWVCVGVA